MTYLFLVDGCAYSRSFCVFSGVAAVNVFSAGNKMMLTSVGEYFSAKGHGDFRAQTFHEVV